MSAFDDSEICRTILENLPTGLCVVDIHKRILFWSSGAERITGHLRHDILGHCCAEQALLHCDERRAETCREECPLARAIKTAQPADAVLSLQHKGGHEIPVRARAVPLRNVHGSIIGAVETFEDQPAATVDHRTASAEATGAIDQVTGLSTRASMESHLRTALSSFTNLQAPFGVLCFRMEGLDHFRASFGSDAALSLLRVLAHTLKGALWQTDFVARWSDDQFLAILNGCREDALRSVCERLRSMLSNDAVEWWGERRSLPVSVGQAIPQPGDTSALLLQRLQNSLIAASTGIARAATATPGSK
jgi:diguanylate cyclase (GGDEF)-like protein/PAS domain S-box-containing protein